MPCNTVNELLIRLVGIQTLRGTMKLDNTFTHVHVEGVLQAGIIRNAVLLHHVSEPKDVGHLLRVKVYWPKARDSSSHGEPLGSSIGRHSDRLLSGLDICHEVGVHHGTRYR